jgi:Na+/H+ antiporter NhaD/arsenite permease-like protein
MSLTAWLAILVFATAYVVIVTDKFNRTLVALLGAAAMIAIGSVRGHEIFFSEDTGIDWNVIFLLFGMMVIVGFLPRPPCRLPRRVVGPGLRRGPVRLMALLIVVTATASALQDNVTAVLLAAPVVLHVCGQPAQFRARLAPT